MKQNHHNQLGLVSKPYNHIKEGMHQIYLDGLIKHLEYVGINHNDVSMIIREPEWYDGYRQSQSLCDLIVCLREREFIGIELKGSMGKRLKGVGQLDMGHRFTRTYLKQPYTKGIFAVYMGEPGKYYHEVIPYDRQKTT